VKPPAPNRRAVVAGLLAAVGSARAEDKPDDDDAASPIAHGALADNALARAFRPPASDTLPGVTLETPDGTLEIADLLKGRTVLMPVWAEWCVPCLIEIPDFARLQAAYGNDTFAIIPVLSAPQKQMTPKATAMLLGLLKATVFTPTVERRFGGQLAMRAGAHGNTFALPCNLLIAPSGKVVARETGLKSNGVEIAVDPKNHYARADRAAAGETQSLWGMPDGDAFVKALTAGFAL
jgi:thiol-disulfide isomerase/thioredoxin